MTSAARDAPSKKIATKKYKFYGQFVQLSRRRRKNYYYTLSMGVRQEIKKNKGKVGKNTLYQWGNTGK